eukprot:TRINITY_DN80477_c0_g1_i1.p2 TRINITY_DN80477_c0_g1~~TRINITY_DN80477_c0_g1_i1.p2  ORF type:complete len:141 (+),score=36.25 TRINITY_DN80477_c0_g1_i1:319-741(+)
MASIEPGAGHGGDEELAAVRAWTSICHGEEERLLMAEFEVLIAKLHSIDAFATSAVEASEITSLAHEFGDDAMENRTLVVEWLSRAANALLSCAQTPEVLSSLGDNVSKKLKDNAGRCLATNADIEENAWVRHDSEKVVE